MTQHILTTLAAALLCSACATPNMAPNMTPATDSVALAPQLSTQGFDATETDLRGAIASRGLTLFTVVDHGKGARSVGRDIGQSKLFIFGNPKAGTPLMEADPTLGMELPLRVLIYTDGARQTYVLNSDIPKVAEEYDIDGQDARIAKIDDTLSTIVDEARGL